jgi:hypothetical protein
MNLLSSDNTQQALQIRYGQKTRQDNKENRKNCFLNKKFLLQNQLQNKFKAQNSKRIKEALNEIFIRIYPNSYKKLKYTRLLSLRKASVYLYQIYLVRVKQNFYQTNEVSDI